MSPRYTPPSLKLRCGKQRNAPGNATSRIQAVGYAITWMGRLQEAAHTWTDDGEANDDFINSHSLERLYQINFTDWIIYKYEYRKIFE